MNFFVASAVLIAGWLLVDLVCACLDVFSITGAGLRFIRSQLNGTRFIEIPAELSPAIANGLIGKGSELVAGGDPEWHEGSVRRFPIAAQLPVIPDGTIVRIENLSRRRMEIRVMKS